MNRKTIFYLLFFTLLFLCFYAVITHYTDFAKPKLPSINTVRTFNFTRQDGKIISEKELIGKTYIANYFFTTCNGICPKMNHNMQNLFEQLKGDKNFMILSHTVDPERDSVQRLKHYADSLQAPINQWWFLTGSKQSLYKVARESYLLDDPKNSSKNIEEQFLHTQFFALVDKNGVVRGIYDGLKKDELKQLVIDTQLLLSQY
ncbi:MAG: SCO family protein [Chitinophagaceae bacterium]|jgi:protein SCO1/2|nr:SCO family protein [Chitinophagaceae bacterium]